MDFDTLNDKKSLFTMRNVAIGVGVVVALGITCFGVKGLIADKPSSGKTTTTTTTTSVEVPKPDVVDTEEFNLEEYPDMKKFADSHKDEFGGMTTDEKKRMAHLMEKYKKEREALAEDILAYQNADIADGVLQTYWRKSSYAGPVNPLPHAHDAVYCYKQVRDVEGLDVVVGEKSVPEIVPELKEFLAAAKLRDPVPTEEQLGKIAEAYVEDRDKYNEEVQEFRSKATKYNKALIEYQVKLGAVRFITAGLKVPEGGNLEPPTARRRLGAIVAEIAPPSTLEEKVVEKDSKVLLDRLTE
jgi:hypothetical protein